MTRINTNVQSLIAQNTLQRSNTDLNTALGRLSTGLRINSGKDDPAGLIASEALGSDITATQKGITNSQRADQLISTADAALGQVSSLLNDVRGLVSEAANSGAQSAEQIAANQLQIDSSLEAIDRIAQTTTFQGRNLLDGTLDFITSGVDTSKAKDVRVDQANFGTRNSISVGIDVVKQATRGQLNFGLGAIANDVVLEVAGRNGAETFNFAGGSSINEIATAINQVSDATGVEAKVGADATKGAATISSAGGDNNITLTANQAGLDAGNVHINYVQGDSSGTTADFVQGSNGDPSQINVKLQTTEGVNATGLVNDDVAATLTTTAGATVDPANAQFKLTAKTTGAAGNNVRLVVAQQDNQGNGPEVAVTQNGANTDITVTLDTDAANGGANSKLTANDLIAALQNNNDANQLVSAELTPTSDGSGELGTLVATALSGGADVADNAFNVTSRIAGEDFSDVSVHFVDGDKAQVGAFATTDLYLDYQSDAQKAKAALDLGGAGDDILLTASKAGSQFNDVKIRFVSSTGLGDAANATYDADNKELVVEVDDADGTKVGTLVQAINDEGTFKVSADTSDGETLNNAQAVTTASALALTGDTGKTGSDGKTIFVYHDAANTAANVITELGTPTDARSRRVNALFDIKLANNNDGSGVISELALDKVITGGVTAGQTVATANDVVQAINNSAAGAVVTAGLAAGNSGFGTVTDFDKFAFTGNTDQNNRLQFLAGANAPKIRYSSTPGQALGLSVEGRVEGQSSVTIQGGNANSSLVFTAKKAGSEYDGYEVVFKDDQNLVTAAGEEQVLVDQSKKRVTVLINDGATKASDVINALAGDEYASKFFTAADFGSSDGTGLVQASDTDLNNSDLNLKTSGGLVDPGTLVVNLETDASGVVKTTANDIVNLLQNPSSKISDPDDAAAAQSLIDEYDISASNAEGSNGQGVVSPTTDDVNFQSLGETFTDAKASGRTTSVNGTNAQLKFTAAQEGTAFDGVQVKFVDDENITSGNEVGSYDDATKTLTFRIDAGNTTADDIFNIFTSSDPNYDADLASKFSAKLVGTGAGVVTIDDTATLSGGQTQTHSADGAALLGNSDASSSGLTFESTDFGSANFVQVKTLSGEFSLTNSDGVAADRAEGSDVDARINGIQAVGDGLQASINTASLDVSLSVDANVGSGTQINFSILGGGAQFQLGPDVVSNQQARLGLQAVNSARLGGVSGQLYQLRSGGANSLANDVTGAAAIVNEAITQVTQLRGRLGAFQKTTLETNIFSLSTTLENLTEAQSSIRDADFAQESAKLTRAQILVQSGTKVLSIANSNPQNALSLLR